jgi:stage III sporulation protein SpoIIIAA
MEQRKITDDLQALLDVLPPQIAGAVTEVNDFDNLLEVILDLGRLSTARFVDTELVLNPKETTRKDIDYVVERIGEFDTDNRAGLERTLHRISAIRNRRGHIVGLTCRVGRAVYGTTDIINDLIGGGKSLLLLGRPGVGKTTMLREAARILAEDKRVVIVDTSNEIGGDGDVPHPAVGRARRMQVATPALQHEVMIEAVENHNPEIIVIDEIGRELEATAARTIAERGVQLIGTAHGNTLENLFLNPTLSDLVGGIESVTLSDDEARRRGTQKTVLERRSPPTFDMLIEILNRDRLAVHPDVAAAVDALLRGYPLPPEIRTRVEGGEIRVERAPAPANQLARTGGGFRRQAAGQVNEVYAPKRSKGERAVSQESTRDVTLRSYYRKRQRTIVDAENRNMPIYVLRSNTVNQMGRFLTDLFNLAFESAGDLGMEPILQETQAAIEAVRNGERWVELTPAASSVRRMQHQMARDAHLVSHSYGKEPRRRVRIYRDDR